MQPEDIQERLLELGFEEDKEYSLAEIENVFLENRDIYILANIRPEYDIQIYHAEDADDNDSCYALLFVGTRDKANQIIFHSGETLDTEGAMYDGCSYETLIEAFQLDKSQRIWSVSVDSNTED